jgi:hypothetical protein
MTAADKPLCLPRGHPRFATSIGQRFGRLSLDIRQARREYHVEAGQRVGWLTVLRQERVPGRRGYAFVVPRH